jgi:DNA adenine methylase
MASPSEILDLAYQRAAENIKTSFIEATSIADGVEYVCRNLQNRAGVRLLMACLLAKVDRPEVDVRKPYTEIEDDDSFSGRTYDEQYITPFIHDHGLPCNPTTAFLTPAFRNRNATLTPDLNLVGRPPRLYQTVLQLLTDVHQGMVLFHRLRLAFLEAYQELVLVEPESAVSQPLKEVFLALRQAAESRE